MFEIRSNHASIFGQSFRMKPKGIIYLASQTAITIINFSEGEYVMCKKAPGKSSRQGITLVQLMEMFPDEATAHAWFVKRRWGTTGRFCPRCKSSETQGTPGTMPYWCPSCRHRFSIRTGTILERSKIPLRKWVIAIYLCATSRKGVSSMKLHRDLGITQKSAWFMLHRIREAMKSQTGVFTGPVEVDETTIGGERKNMPKAKRERLTGRGAVG